MNLFYLCVLCSGVYSVYLYPLVYFIFIHSSIYMLMLKLGLRIPFSLVRHNHMQTLQTCKSWEWEVVSWSGNGKKYSVKQVWELRLSFLHRRSRGCRCRLLCRIDWDLRPKSPLFCVNPSQTIIIVKLWLHRFVYSLKKTGYSPKVKANKAYSS